MTPAYFTLLKRAGYLGNENQIFAGETAVAMMLSTEKKENTLCKIEAVEKMYCCDVETQCIASLQTDIDYIMVGTNGVAENDNVYFENCVKLFPTVPLLQYKNIFGEGYTTPALGVYAAAICLQKGKIPEHLFLDTKYKIQNTKQFNRVLCYNQFEGKNHTFILLSK